MPSSCGINPAKTERPAEGGGGRCSTCPSSTADSRAGLPWQSDRINNFERPDELKTLLTMQDSNFFRTPSLPGTDLGAHAAHADDHLADRGRGGEEADRPGLGLNPKPYAPNPKP